MNSTEAIIYLDNIRYNLRTIKNKIGQTDIIAVIKGDAYSHGILDVARICAEEGIKKFCVGSLEEAISLRKNGFKEQPILLLLPPNIENIDDIIRYNISPTVYKLEQLHLIKNKKSNLPFEIEIDTGIGRSGCRNGTFYDMIHFIERNKMNLKAIYTHLYDKYNYCKCVKQLNEFKKYKCDISGVKYHIGGAYSLCYGKDFLLDELRVGIGIYGLADMTIAGCTLKPTLELNTKICDIINIEKGRRIGYNKNEFIFKRDSKLALLNFGLSMGYPNIEKSIVKVKNCFCEIVGGINMMNCCVDITDVEKVDIGDWVNIYSVDNKDLNSILKLSEINNMKPGKFVYGLNNYYFKRKYILD